MCTLGRQACTRRVCFFAHSPSELREEIPQTLEETGQLRDRLLAEVFTKNVYASVLERILRVMTPSQASEMVSVQILPHSTEYVTFKIVHKHSLL